MLAASLFLLHRRITRNPRPEPVPALFPHADVQALGAREILCVAKIWDIVGIDKVECSIDKTRCTKIGHPLVKQLHSIALKADIAAGFSLTIKMQGVKP